MSRKVVVEFDMDKLCDDTNNIRYACQKAAELVLDTTLALKGNGSSAFANVSTLTIFGGEVVSSILIASCMVGVRESPKEEIKKELTSMINAFHDVLLKTAMTTVDMNYTKAKELLDAEVAKKDQGLPSMGSIINNVLKGFKS